MKIALPVLIALSTWTLSASSVVFDPLNSDEIPSEQSPLAPVFPPIGGAAGQVARITVTADPATRCTATALFRRSTSDPPEPIRLDLGPGQAGFLDFAFTRIVTRFGQRAEVRPEVTVNAGKCSASVEVFESFTGRTMAYLKLFAGLQPPNLVIPSLQDPPEPILTAVGLAQGQIMRLGVARGFDPQPDPPVCDVLLSFADTRGNAAGPAKRVTLAPGAFDFLDLDARVLFPAAAIGSGQRAIAQPRVVSRATATSAAGCHISVQIYEAMTGWTSATYSSR